KIYRQQADVANAITKFFTVEKCRTAFVNGEMGVGKTVIASMVAYGLSQKLEKPIRVLVMCPPQLGGARKGKEDVIQKWEREIKNAIPDAVVKTLNCVADIMYLRQFRKTKPKNNEFYIVSREAVKLGMGYEPALNYGTVKTDDGLTVKIPVCPTCGGEIDVEKLAKTRKNWHECGENHPRRDIEGNSIGSKKKEPLWKYMPKPTRRYPLALLIKHYLKNFFDLFICDEVHEEKGASLRGTAFGQLVRASKKTLSLTGTLVGGKASTLHYLLWRTNPGKMRQISAFNNVNETAMRYGVVEKIFKEKDDEAYYGRRNKRLVSIKEKPGISPVILTDFLIQNTAFLKLADIRAVLPNFKEDVRIVEMDEDLAETYGKFQSDLVSAVEAALRHHDRSLLGKMLISLLAYPDNPRVEEVVQNREGEVVACAPALKIDQTAKERELINIIKEEKASDRKVLVYIEFTNIRDIQPQLKKKIEKEGLKAVILPASVSPAKRESWINRTLKEKDLDCLICNPRLVQTGLDLIDFPTIVFYQTGYSTYLLRQASRRSYRIGQKKAVEIIYLVNKNTMQEQAMSLIASKFIASLMIEGELPAE
ncbi:MAG: DEAD/DEAH box helicase, partial [Acidobacteriota bacterium]|nr:DEAD/DEAH box helicase [Acidobacteriota bacterium]